LLPSKKSQIKAKRKEKNKNNSLSFPKDLLLESRWRKREGLRTRGKGNFYHHPLVKGPLHQSSLGRKRGKKDNKSQGGKESCLRVQ